MAPTALELESDIPRPLESLLQNTRQISSSLTSCAFESLLASKSIALRRVWGWCARFARVWMAVTSRRDNLTCARKAARPSDLPVYRHIFTPEHAQGSGADIRDYTLCSQLFAGYKIDAIGVEELRAEVLAQGAEVPIELRTKGEDGHA